MSAGSVVFAFAAGLISIVTPCVLPLVPGYLSAVSSVEPHRFGEPGIARRVLVSSVPFFVGFTVVFVALGAGAAALGGVLPPDRRTEVAGLIMVVFGLGLADMNGDGTFRPTQDLVIKLADFTGPLTDSDFLL